MSDREKIKDIYAWFCRIIVTLRIGIHKMFRSPSRRVLLVGTSEVTLDYLLPFVDILKKCGITKTSLLVSRYAREYASKRLADFPQDIKLLTMNKALCRVWDIIIFADHNNVHWFHEDIPKIRTPHGLYSGKRLGSDDSYVYGRNSVKETGKLFYDVMFIESSYYLKRLIKENPALKGRVAVVGNLLADDLVNQNKRRDSIRQKLGIASATKVLAIFSTWGEESLIQRFGQSILGKINELSNEYKIYCFIHPMNYHAQFSKRQAILETLEDAQRLGLLYRVPPQESFIPYLVAADMVLTDFGSLFLYYALLNRPYLFTPIESTATTKDSLLWDFYDGQEQFDPQLDIFEQLRQATVNHSPEKGKLLASRLVEPIGRAEELIQVELSKFL